MLTPVAFRTILGDSAWAVAISVLIYTSLNILLITELSGCATGMGPLRARFNFEKSFSIISFNFLGDAVYFNSSL